MVATNRTMRVVIKTIAFYKTEFRRHEYVTCALVKLKSCALQNDPLSTSFSWSLSLSEVGHYFESSELQMLIMKVDVALGNSMAIVVPRMLL